MILSYAGRKDGRRIEGAQWGTVNDGTSVGGGYEARTEVVVDGRDHGKGPEGLGLTEGGKGGGGSRGHRVVGGKDDGLELKGGVGPGGRSIATGLGKKPVGGCYSAEMQRPAIRSTAHDPILSYRRVS